MLLVTMLCCLGYSINANDKPHDFDSSEERYQKVKHVCQQFCAFQIGLCTFKWDDADHKYKMRPFSFYVFPRSQLSDSTVMLQVSLLLSST